MTSTSSTPIFIAHRGESFDAPENTLASINLAWSRNADAVEIDIHLTKDKKIVVIHDEDTKRVCGRKLKIRSTNLNDLKQLKIISQIYPNEYIPTLSEIINTVPESKKIIIEIKTGIEIIPILKNEIINSSLSANQVEFICFDLMVISEIKKTMQNYKAFWLLELDYNWFYRLIKPSIEKLINQAIRNNLDGLDLWAGEMLDNKLVNKIKSHNLIIYIWTVNKPSVAQKYIKFGVNGITTDRANWLKEKISYKL